METSKHSVPHIYGDQLTFSQADFLASPSVLPEKERAIQMTVTSGQKSLELFERLDQSTSWVKMFTVCLLGARGWYSNKCKLTWRMKVTRFKRLYFQLAPSMLPIKETGFGLLPTPVQNTAPYQYSNGDKERPPTPTLIGLMNAGLLPTPQAFDGFKASHGMRQKSITKTVKDFHGKGSLLNHRYVMEMMGYPPDWCDLQLKPEEMPLFLKSLSRSSKQ